jgi:ribosomal protein S18 acetylase RimI-like enzyme
VAIRIRQFQSADFDTLWQIDQACFDPQLAYSRAELAFYMRRPGSFTLVAEAPAGETSVSTSIASASAGSAGNTLATVRKIMGFIVAEVRRQTGHIITIDVVSEARRLGVGSTLLQAAEDRIREKGARAVALETPVNNAAAISFYKRKGYFVEKTLAGYYSGELDALVMTKALAHSVEKT